MKKLLAGLLLVGLLVGCSEPASKNIDVSETKTESIKETQIEQTKQETLTEESTSETSSPEKETSSSSASSGILIDVSNNASPKITQGGVYTISGTNSEVNIQVESNDEVKLILDGLNATNSTQPIIEIDSTGVVTIETIKNSSLNMSADADTKGVIDSKGTLILEGTEKLDIIASVGHGIKSEGAITVNSGNYIFDVASDGIKAELALEINGGDIKVDKANEGIESKDKITINGGNVQVSATDDGINATNAIIVNDGTVKSISSSNDGIDSNGTLTVNGGYVYAEGANVPEAGFDNDQNEFLINGGTVIGLGGSSSTPSNNSKQPVVFASVSGDVTVTDGSSTESITVNGNKTLLVSLSTFKQGSNVTISNGQNSTDVTLSQIVNGNVPSQGRRR